MNRSHQYFRKAPLLLFFLVFFAAAEQETGKEIYLTYCAVCHNAGAVNAPRITKAEDWVLPLESGIDAVYKNALEGIGAHPSRGLCYVCTDEQIKAAVDHLLNTRE